MPEFEYIPELDAVANWGEFRRALERFEREHPVDIETVRAIQKRLSPEQKLSAPLPDCIQKALETAA